MSKISYSAVVLDEESANTLKREYSSYIPDDWKWFGHHMTIKMGELSPDMKQYIGQEIDLVVDTIGQDERAIAAGIGAGGDLSKNEIPHITLAVNINGGGKPFHSNKIPKENWKPVGNRIRLTGHVTEIPQQ